MFAISYPSPIRCNCPNRNRATTSGWLASCPPGSPSPKSRPIQILDASDQLYNCTSQLQAAALLFCPFYLLSHNELHVQLLVRSRVTLRHLRVLQNPFGSASKVILDPVRKAEAPAKPDQGSSCAAKYSDDRQSGMIGGRRRSAGRMRGRRGVCGMLSGGRRGRRGAGGGLTAVQILQGAHFGFVAGHGANAARGSAGGGKRGDAGNVVADGGAANGFFVVERFAAERRIDEQIALCRS